MTRRGLLLFALCGAFAQGAAAAGRSCESIVQVAPAAGYHISVPPAEPAVRQIEPEFFGFTLEWLGFQTDLWDAKGRHVAPELVAALKAFPGAVYRYPGGGAANHFNWTDSVGDHEKRPRKKVVDWLGPVSVDFGFDEYLSFVRSAGGRPWVVLNLYGTKGGETAPALLLERAKSWVDYATAKAQAGGDPVMRWELGNELDRGPTKSWSPGKYVEIAAAFGGAINMAHPTAKTVGMLQDWKAQTFHTLAGYNRQVMTGLRGITEEYAHHLYLDGPPAAREVPHRFAVVCQTVANARKVGVAHPRIWITEYGRDIPHRYDNSPGWRQSWPKTVNLEAALGVADAMILGVQIPEIAGMFAHGLGATKGPWPMFHADGSGGLHASAVFNALRLLREDMLPVVLETHVRSTNHSGYAGGYDVRATVVSSPSRDRYAVWAVNRAPQAAKVELRIPGLAGHACEAQHRRLSGSGLEASNHSEPGRVGIVESKRHLAFDGTGTAYIELPPYSVSNIGLAR